jgi:hypothetical protein
VDLIIEDWKPVSQLPIFYGSIRTSFQIVGKEIIFVSAGPGDASVTSGTTWQKLNAAFASR